MAEVGEGSDGTGSEERFEVVEGVLAVSAPVEDHVFPGQGMQGAGDGCKMFYISPVIPGETKERADLGGGFGRRDLQDGREECRVWQEAFLCNPVPQITDLLGGEGAFLHPQLEISVPQSLEDLTELCKMFLPCGGEDDNVVKIKEARFPMETREDAIHEVGEGSGSVAETKWDLVEPIQLPTAGTKRCFLFIPLHDRDLPVPTFQIQSGEPASPM